MLFDCNGATSIWSRMTALVTLWFQLKDGAKKMISQVKNIESQPQGHLYVPLKIRINSIAMLRSSLMILVLKNLMQQNMQ